jgi:hypothetical protein
MNEADFGWRYPPGVTERDISGPDQPEEIDTTSDEEATKRETILDNIFDILEADSNTPQAIRDAMTAARACPYTRRDGKQVPLAFFPGTIDALKKPDACVAETVAKCGEQAGQAIKTILDYVIQCDKDFGLDEFYWCAPNKIQKLIDNNVEEVRRDAAMPTGADWDEDRDGGRDR